MAHMWMGRADWHRPGASSGATGHGAPAVPPQGQTGVHPPAGNHAADAGGIEREVPARPDLTHTGAPRQGLGCWGVHCRGSTGAPSGVLGGSQVGWGRLAAEETWLAEIKCGRAAAASVQTTFLHNTASGPRKTMPYSGEGSGGPIQKKTQNHKTRGNRGRLCLEYASVPYSIKKVECRLEAIQPRSS